MGKVRIPACRMAGPSRRRREENPALEGYFRHGRGDAGSGESADRHAGFPGKGAEKRGKSAGFFRSFSTAANRLPEGDRCSVRVGGVGSEEAVFHSFPVDVSSFGKPGVCRGIRRRAESLSICGAKVEVSSKRGAAGGLSGRFPPGPIGRNCRSAGRCGGVKAAFRRNPARSATDGARFPQKFSTGCGNIGGKTKRISRGFARAEPAEEGVWERCGNAFAKRMISQEGGIGKFRIKNSEFRIEVETASGFNQIQSRTISCCTFAGTSLTRQAASSAMSVLLAFPAS